MFTNKFIEKLIEDYKQGKSKIRIKTNSCIEPGHLLEIETEKNWYYFTIDKQQVQMLEYLMEE